MSEMLKFIVAELNKPPFKRGYSLISFDSLEGLSLLQVLTDVLADIEPSQKIDVREETPEETAMRVFEMLRIFKYNPDEDQSSFRQGVVEGKKRTIHPALGWILRRKEELKERAYLARYLIKVEIPAEYLVDGVVGDLYEQYTGLMESFKETHKYLSSLHSSEFNASDVKKDIISMETEKDQLTRRVDKLKKKAESVENSEPMLEASRNLRSENDRNIKIHQQKQDQRNLITQIDQRILRLQQQLKEKRQSSIGMTPHGLLQRLEEEVSSNSYLVKTKLPQELNSLRSELDEVMKVALEPAMGQSDLDTIQQKIRSTNSEINKLLERKMSNMADSKISGGELYRQQASIVRNKKDSVAEVFNKVRNEVHKLEVECNQKKMKMNELNGGEEVMSTEELRKLAQQLRSKHMDYKEKRKELLELKVEADILTRTEEVLDKQSQHLQQQLAAYESSHGVSGYHETQDALENTSSAKRDLDEEKSKRLEDISLVVQQLNNKIDRKKQILAPIIRELRPLRQEIQEISAKHKEKKSKYEAVQAGFEGSWSNLEREVSSLEEGVNLDESRIHLLNMTMKADEVLMERAEKEIKLHSGSDDKRKSFREIMNKKIQEQEHLGKQLKEKQLSLKDNQENNTNQTKMWRDLEKLFQLKLKLARSGNSHESKNDRGSMKGNSSNRLIL